MSETCQWLYDLSIDLDDPEHDYKINDKNLEGSLTNGQTRSVYN